ncbi:MAG: c-type cytochrome [Planctomycetales bacterium]|nr:c-type cytochrome [Planctomycetales bacterium]
MAGVVFRWRIWSLRWLALCAVGVSFPTTTYTGEVHLHGTAFQIPDHMEFVAAADTSLVERPICVDLDEAGNLYVAESSGTNDRVEKQLEERPHRILRLEDTDADGVYDQRSVFADKMMFPEGTLWHAGSLYVAAPPSIWKLTDSDGDGVADQREEWFQGKTLTGCANDLHGPYLGLDGWIYWCKGAFAEQTYERQGELPLITRAAHIFRRHPSGGAIEPVMTGGMDNPVEVAFSPTGERFFTTTFFQHPAGGQRDGLVHAIYGGVYGKPHGVLEGHPRTGELMPVLTHLGAAAPAGLALLESNHLGDGYAGSLVASLFNLHKVTRHELMPNGSSFTTVDHDLVSSENLDFHPTDVIEDGDGSLLIVNTGGWYKLCCPTSQLWKPDVLGGIYRLRPRMSAPVEDPFGQEFDWRSASVEQLSQWLDDDRPRVRRRAVAELAGRDSDVAGQLRSVLRTSASERQRCLAVWTLTRRSESAARAAVRESLADASSAVRQVALQSASLHRDSGAFDQLVGLLLSDLPIESRLAAEALGRTRRSAASAPLLAAAQRTNDRAHEHAVTYALIELNNPAATRAGLLAAAWPARRTALIALDQMPDGQLDSADVAPGLASEHALLRQTATGIVARHPEWTELIRSHLVACVTDPDVADPVRDDALALLRATIGSTDVQAVVAELIRRDDLADSVRLQILDAMAASRLQQLPGDWELALRDLFVRHATDVGIVAAVGRILEETTIDVAARQTWAQLLIDASRKAESLVTRLTLWAALPADSPLDDGSVKVLLDSIESSAPVEQRAQALRALEKIGWTSAQRESLVKAVADVGPLEIDRVLGIIGRNTSAELRPLLFKALEEAPGAPALSAGVLRERLKGWPREYTDGVVALLERRVPGREEQVARIESLLARLGQGDVRRGQQVFYGQKAACFSCHALGYLGGDVGPDLSRIGQIRTPRDLAESILYPSLSFVRSYEPWNVATVDGRVTSGVMREQTGNYVEIIDSQRRLIRISRPTIEEMTPATVSIMPAGFDQNLTEQELLDLLAFLREGR